MAEAAVQLDPPQHAEDDQVVVIRGATWADYQRLLEVRGESAAPRLSYLEGALEIMAPSRAHESITEMIGCLVEAWCVEHGVEVTPYGSWTLEKKDADRGLEPDQCYVVGDDADPERPDLAIEVVRSSGGLRKLDIYRQLGVREVWTWRKGAITVSLLRDGQYVTAEASEVLAGIDLPLLLRFVDERPMTRAVRHYLRAMRAAGSTT